MTAAQKVRQAAAQMLRQLLVWLAVIVNRAARNLPASPAVPLRTVELGPDVVAVAVTADGVVAVTRRRHSVETVSPEVARYCLPGTLAERAGWYPPTPEPDPEPVPAPEPEPEPEVESTQEPPPLIDLDAPYVDVPQPGNYQRSYWSPIVPVDDPVDVAAEVPAPGGYSGPAGPDSPGPRRPATLADFGALHTYPKALEAAAA